MAIDAKDKKSIEGAITTRHHCNNNPAKFFIGVFSSGSHSGSCGSESKTRSAILINIHGDRTIFCT